MGGGGSCRHGVGAGALLACVWVHEQSFRRGCLVTWEWRAGHRPTGPRQVGRAVGDKGRQDEGGGEGCAPHGIQVLHLQLTATELDVVHLGEALFQVLDALLGDEIWVRACASEGREVTVWGEEIEIMGE